MHPKLNIRNPRILLYVLLGAVFGLSVYGYWLSDIFPPASRRLFLFSVLAGTGGTFGYFTLFEFWLIPRLAVLPGIEFRRALFWGAGIGLFAMFAGTNAWMSPVRYLAFLLPEQTLEITVPPGPDGSFPETAIVWISTSLGDISFDALQLNGWERDGGRLRLTGGADNSLRWEGRTGADVLLLFERSPQAGVVNVSWGGISETLDLRSARPMAYEKRHVFPIPFAASPIAVLLLVSVNFILAGLALHLLFLRERERLHAVLQGADRLQPADRRLLLLGMTVIVLLALGLRIFRLGDYYPFTDEYSHLIAADEIWRGMPLNEIYDRSLYIVTLPVTAAYALFGSSLWAARLPGVLFNVLALLPLYLIVRRVNRAAAALSCIFFAVSPYIIAFARNVREYAYYPLYFYAVVFVMVLFLEGFPARFVLWRDWKKLPLNYAGFILILALPILHSLVLDRLSTFRLILLAYAVFGLFLLAKFDLHSRTNWLTILLAGAAAFAGLHDYIQRFLAAPTLDLRPLEFFFPNPPQQWYFARLALVPALVFLAGMYIAFLLRRRNFIPVFLWALFTAYMLFFIFYFNRTGFNMHPRFVLSAQLWFLPVLALGACGVWVFLHTLFNGRTGLTVMAAAALVLSSFNLEQVLLPTFFRGELMPITQLVHDDFDLAQAYLLAHVSPGDVLIGGVYARYADWRDEPRFAAIYNYSNQRLNSEGVDGYAYISAIIAQHPSGWIVIDEIRMQFIPPSLPFEPVMVNGRRVEYVGQFLSQHIWRWSVK